MIDVPANKRLRGQTQSQLEAEGKGRNLRHTADLRCAVIELIEGLLLRFRQRLCQLFFVPGDELQDMCVFSSFAVAALRWGDIAVEQLCYDAFHCVTSFGSTIRTREGRK